MKGSLLLFNFKLNCLIFFYQSIQLTDIYMDVYCKLSKCIGHTLCSYEHYLVSVAVARELFLSLCIVCNYHPASLGNFIHELLVPSACLSSVLL